MARLSTVIPLQMSTRAQGRSPASGCPSSQVFRHPVYGMDLRDAYMYAQRLGLDADAAEDCAMAFLLHKLERGKPFGQNGALRRRCAHDFAFNVVRARRSRPEIAFHDLAICQAEDGELFEANVYPAPEQVLLRKELWEFLLPFLNRLRPLPRQLLWHHHVIGEGVSQLATAMGLTTHAVEQSLCRTRRRVRELLEREGVGAQELWEYLAPAE